VCNGEKKGKYGANCWQEIPRYNLRSSLLVIQAPNASAKEARHVLAEDSEVAKYSTTPVQSNLAE
jgi:hypothetical protein